MSLRSSIMSKLDHKMSRIWKKVASSFCKVVANLTVWKTEYLIAQRRTGIWWKVFRLKHVLKVYFKPSRKKIFCILPLPILPVRLKILHLCINSSFFETGALPTPTKSRNPTNCGWGGSFQVSENSFPHIFFQILALETSQKVYKHPHVKEFLSK